MGSHHKTAHKVNIAMKHMDKPCIGEPCDVDAPCKRHKRTTTLVRRITK